VEAKTLQKPKRFLGAPRNIESGGSLYIIATTLIDTGSEIDEVILEELNGTGNKELHIARKLSNNSIVPAVNKEASSPRRDELLLDKLTRDRKGILRKCLANENQIEAKDSVQNRL